MAKHPKSKEIKQRIIELLKENEIVNLWEVLDILVNLFMAVCDNQEVPKDVFLALCMKMNNAYIDARNKQNKQ
jgi:hypothetical protein